MRALPISVEASGLWSNVQLEAPARKWNLSSYDAAYLDLALRKSVPLASIDADLRKAAATVGVELLS